MTISEKCPICGAELLLTDIVALVQDKNGEWLADDIDLQCTAEPSIDSEDWEDWNDWHYRMPYVDWLPLEIQIIQDLQKKFFFAAMDEK